MTDGDLTRITFALPTREREALEQLGRDRDLTLAQLARRGIRLVLEAERPDLREVIHS